MCIWWVFYFCDIFEYLYLFKYLSKVEKDDEFCNVKSLNDIWLDSEGCIQFFSDEKSTSEAEFLDAFGKVIFDALDYGYGDDDEPDLPEDLENLVSYMTGNFS